MFVEKYKSGLILLFVMHNIGAMELATVDKDKVDEEKCWRVARYLALTDNKVDKEELNKRNDFLGNNTNPSVQCVIKYSQIFISDKSAVCDFINKIPNMTFSELHTSLYTPESKLNDEEKQYIHFLSQQNMYVFVSMNKDIFTALCSSLPEAYEDHGGFFNPAFHDDVPPDINMVRPDFLLMVAAMNRPQQEEKPKVNKTITRDEMIKELKEMSIAKALSVFRYLTQQGIEMNARFDSIISDECSKGIKTKYTEGKKYYFTYEDLANMTAQSENLLRSVVDYSNKGNRHNIDKRFMITDEHIDHLQLQKKFILQNGLFKNAQIITDITPHTLFEKAKDKFLFWAPHVLIMVAPDLVHSKITGALQGTAGLLVCGVGSSLFGHHVYPVIDSYNSNLDKLSSWFGVNNYAKDRRGMAFCFLSVLHYGSTAMAQKILSWKALPWQVLGGAIYVLRIGASLFALINNEAYINKHAFRRASKAGLPFTLGDLVNGPKFQTQE